MASTLLPCQPWLPLTSFLHGNVLKKHKLHHHHHYEGRSMAAISGSRNYLRINNNKTSSFNYRSSTGVPLHELPWASFDQYMEDKGRVIQAIFPEQSTSQQLNEEEWKVKMTPIEALFLKCEPVIHITAKSISEVDDYPPEIPGHITKFLEVQITRCEFPDLHADYIPPDFNINARGALYLEREGKDNLMKNHLDISLSLSFPPLLAWVPDYVLQNIVQSVLRNYVEDINNGFAVRLLADYNLFKRNTPKN
ncbi:uncharacterized protein LOC113867628 [Abrus precatorius]|uniref:Uncharacterized protein LOC113867628 n=1 Tax=Abrus precatorius TaxID=3816 RepID=A0A8B8LRC2_ABRPR|nr:uncharacterized protein LOC113867628 [Abrus precatorius]